MFTVFQVYCLSYKQGRDNIHSPSHHPSAVRHSSTVALMTTLHPFTAGHRSVPTGGGGGGSSEKGRRGLPRYLQHQLARPGDPGPGRRVTNLLKVV